MAEDNGKEWRNTIDLGYLVQLYNDVATGVVDDAVDLVAKRADKAIPRRTGKTAKSQSTGRKGLTGYVSYHSKKAVPLHENMHVRHRRGRAKFLETELAGSAATIRRNAVAAFQAATKGGHR